MKLTTQTQFQTPNYPYYYGAHQSCSWHIIAPEGKFAGVNVTHIRLASAVKDIEVNGCI